MKLVSQINDPVICRASKIVLDHYGDYSFLDMIASVPKFNHTEMSSLEVSLQLLKMNDLNVTIRPWKPAWMWSKAIARADYKNALIEFNVRKTGTLQDRVETIWHECAHLVGFTHNGNNVTQYNLNTVPYLGASLFVKYLKKIQVL